MSSARIVSTERKCEFFGIIMLALTVVLFLSLITDGFEAGQQSGRPIDGMLEVPNLLGAPGALVAGLLALLFGDAAHVLYAVTFIWMLKLFVHRPVGRLLTRIMGLILLTGSVAGLLQIDMAEGVSNAQPGGAFGVFVAERLLMPNFGMIGSNVIGLMVACMGVLLATDFLFIHIFLLAQRCVFFFLRGLWHIVRWLVGGDIPKTEPARQAPMQDAYALAADFNADIPETWDLSSKGDAPSRRGGAKQWLRRLVPRIVSKEQAHMPAPNEALPEAMREHTPAQEPPHIHLPAADDADDLPLLPFDDVPDSFVDEGRAPTDGMPACAEAAELRDAMPKLTSAPGGTGNSVAAPDEPRFEESREIRTGAAAAFESRVPKSDTFASSMDTPEYDVDRLMKPAATAGKSGPRLRRKQEELAGPSHDYQYPPAYTPPPLDLFEAPVRRVIPNLREKLGRMATRLEETLSTFGLEARVTDVTRGPTITRFEIEPAPGMKVSRFLSLTDDIALALKAKGVRVEAPIPGKGRVGIEVSNEERDPVIIRELLDHHVFREGRRELVLALGKDIAGDVRIADLMRMPHLLVAGATGSGKTVCIKALLASLLFRHTPDELQLMLIDPKMVELSIFNDIPHLITPVVTDPKKASTALTWLINEMEERYRLFADLRVRNIEVYNESVENGEIEMENESAPGKRAVSIVRKLPYIVCVIDELADLMMLARAEVEDAIARLAQLARAVGIHMIIATQRPSVDVLTGVIKANFPARISFQVSSRVDSRCILDEIGAERLIGMGDLLYLPAGQSKPARLQGAFVSDEEMLALIAYLKRQAPAQYRDEIENFGKDKDTLAQLEHEDDPLFEDAVRVVLETGQASISMVQRRLRVGYTRAARLIDMMELKGIVGPHTGSKAREILVTMSPEDD